VDPPPSMTGLPGGGPRFPLCRSIQSTASVVMLTCALYKLAVDPTGAVGPPLKAFRAELLRNRGCVRNDPFPFSRSKEAADYTLLGPLLPLTRQPAYSWMPRVFASHSIAICAALVHASLAPAIPVILGDIAKNLAFLLCHRHTGA